MAERMTDSGIATPGVEINKPCTRTAMPIVMAVRALRMCFPFAVEEEWKT
jgi:hypothetical protein